MSAKPVVYFIDDSATMREVIKIAFRREDMDVITCHDATSALDLMEHTAPDVVITDVIMPGRDGYEVCDHIKAHPRFAHTPVILMSGVVNKGVAEKAFSVHANELIRKPFQPQDLIARVRHLLKPSAHVEPEPPQTASVDANALLNTIFNGPLPTRSTHGNSRPSGPVPVPPPMTSPGMHPALAAAASQNGPMAVPRQAPRQTASNIAATVAAALQPPVVAPPVSIPGAQITGSTQLSVPPPMPGRVPPPPIPGAHSDAGRMRLEILRLQSQIKKLEAELVAEREYSRALEQHVDTLQESE